MSAGDRSELSPERRELLELLLESQTGSVTEPEPPSPVAGPSAPCSDDATGDNRAPLSLVQERMWVSERLAGAAPGSRCSLRCDLRGPLDAAALERAIREIIARHDVLRTRFVDDNGPIAIVDSNVSFTLPVVDLRSHSCEEREIEIRRLIGIEHAPQEAFDLANGPLHRAHLLRIADEQHTLILSVHHIVFDGWSGGVFAHELGQLYEAFVHDRPSPLPPLATQFGDYAAWQREWIKSDECQFQLAFWRDSLQGELPVTQLPSDRPRNAARATGSFAAEHIKFRFPSPLCRKIEALNREAGTTTFMALLAGLQTLLYRCTGQEDMIIGSPAANRSRAETEPLIGCFMHPLLLRTDLRGAPTFRDLLERVRKVCLEAYRRQDAPFELVARSLRPEWTAAASPLFQVLFNVQPKRTASFQLTGLEVDRFDMTIPTTALDLSLHIWTSDEYEGLIEYRSALFDEATIRWFSDRFVAFMEAAITNPDAAIESLAVRPSSRQANELPAAQERSETAVATQGEISDTRRELLDLLLREKAANSQSDHASREPVEADRASAIPRHVRVADAAPVSFGQERLWFFEQMADEKSLLNQSQQLMLRGPLNVRALENSLNALSRRHEMLRTGFDAVDGRPVQRVAKTIEIELPKFDFSNMDSGQSSQALAELTESQARRAFNLRQPPLVRFSLAKLDADQHCLIFTIHHLIGDGWSLRVFRKELAALYQSYCQDDERGEELAHLGELPNQYVDFAVWQRHAYRELVVQGELTYWKRKLAGELPVLDLPNGDALPAIPNQRSGSTTCELSESLSARLQTLGRAAGATQFMVFLAAFKCLLHRYSGQTDLIVDSPVAGRNRRELEGLIGFFVNSLALRTDLGGRPTFRESIARVRDTCLGAFAHQELPFDRVVAGLSTNAARRGQPVARTSFMLHTDITEELELGGGVQMIPLAPDVNDEFDLTLIVWQGDGRFRCEFHYKEPPFAPATIERMTLHWRRLLESLTAEPDRSIAQAPMLEESEHEFLVDECNRTDSPRDPKAAVHGLFQEQASRTPDAPALHFPAALHPQGRSETLSYGELNRRANRLARVLRSQGVGVESRVGVLLDRSTDMFVAILGVLKAGAVYVPLDADYPPQRLDWMIRDAELAMLLANSRCVEQLEETLGQTNAPMLLTDQLLSERDIDGGEADDDPPLINSPEDPAYMIYTSGSTGQPKGVLVPHRAVVNHNLSVVKAFELAPEDRVLQFHSLSFDAAVEETFPTWAAGGTVVMRGADLLSPSDLDKLITSEELTVVNLPTSYWHEWVAEASAANCIAHETLRLTIVGGDKASSTQIVAWNRLTQGRVRWLNTYGPTETTVISTLDETPPDHELAVGRVAIGRPIENTQVYVLDAEMLPAPVGVAGEMYIGGAGVARGYHNRPGVTAERFVPNPFSRAGDRLYRTGDRTRRLADGRIEFLGRVDHQIKIRGFRVEPGEIEAKLCEMEGVQRAVVTPFKEANREEQLVAYVVPHDGAQAESSANAELVETLRNNLREALPAYMNPSWIVVLDRLPLTENGKVDRRALPKPQEEAAGKRKFAPPTTDAQRRIAAIWSEILGLDRVGIQDNFFDLGGHSLLLFQLQHQLNAEFGCDLPAVELFRLATVHDQAARLDGEQNRDSFQAVRDRAAKQKSSLLMKKQQRAAARRRQKKTRDHE